MSTRTATPYLRLLKFTRPIDTPSAKVALAMLLRLDGGTHMYVDVAGRIVAVYSGRDYSPEIAYVAGKFAHSNPENRGCHPLLFGSLTAQSLTAHSFR